MMCLSCFLRYILLHRLFADYPLLRRSPNDAEAAAHRPTIYLRHQLSASMPAIILH